MEIRATSAEADTVKIGAYLWLMFAICFLGNVLGGAASTVDVGLPPGSGKRYSRHR